MIEALDAGTIFCFVHYDESVPKYYEHGFNTGQMSKPDIENYSKMQLGFRWIYPFSIKPIRIDQLITSGDISRNEFKVFLDKWGASHNVFKTFGKGEFDDKIVFINDLALGFMIGVRSGRIIYLPFQRDHSRKDDLIQGLQYLIDCLLTYITRTSIEVPMWGKSPFFEEEVFIRQECDELERKLEDAFARLYPFEEAKSLLFQSEYRLESTVPSFIINRLNINTERDEKYKEDFWILDEKGNKAIIAEVKSIVKGFKRSAIFSLYNHREENKLNESFPGLLVVNCNLQAASWKDKDRAIDKQDFQIAAQNNILILRVEDLLRIWDAVRKEKLLVKDVLDLFLSKKGWLQVGQDLRIHEHK